MPFPIFAWFSFRMQLHSESSQEVVNQLTAKQLKALCEDLVQEGAKEPKSVPLHLGTASREEEGSHDTSGLFRLLSGSVLQQG